MSAKTFLILSDIHASDQDPSSSNAPSYVSSVNAGASGKLDPISDLVRLLNQEAISPDFMLCAGDITNKAHPGSLSFAWSRLNETAGALGTKLVATVGNHDLDSRYKDNKFDPKGYAMALSPKLPVDDRLNYLEFWSENFTVLHHDGVNIVTLNTAAYHGGGEDAGQEIEHGRISEMTLANLEDRLKSMVEAPVNVLLCHHHPLKGDGGDSDSGGPTRGGERLVEVLDRSERPWIIVHGHKHVPDLFYGHGGGNSPVILACASFSAQVNTDAQNKNPNQVHLLSWDPDAAAAGAMVSAGSITSWTWLPGVGWKPANPNQGLPYRAGFGFRSDSGSLVQAVTAHLTSKKAASLAWGNAVSQIPSISHLIPTDFSRFQGQLEKAGLTILSDRHGIPAQIGKRIDA